MNFPKEKMKMFLEKAFDCGLHGYEGLKSDCVDRLLSEVEKEIPFVVNNAPDNGIFYSISPFGSSDMTISNADYMTDLNYISFSDNN
jgi:hypothetical protein